MSKSKGKRKVNNMITGYKKKPPCHTGHKLIFTVPTSYGDVKVWAGGKTRQGGWDKMNPYPEVAIGPSETLSSYVMSAQSKVPEGWECNNHLQHEILPAMVSLDWPDFSIPYVEDTFWSALVRDIFEQEITNVSTQCAGGHGRTGVQLSILAYLMWDNLRDSWVDANALITWMREKHCDNAVENKEQQEYIAKICDIPVGDIVESHKSWGTQTNVVNNNFTWVDSFYKQDDIIDDGLDTLIGNEVIQNECIICLHDSVDNMGICLSCGTDIILHEELLLGEKDLCPTCGCYLPEVEMMDGVRVCRICWGRDTHKMLDRNNELKCDKCRKYHPSTSFFNNIMGVEYPNQSKVCAHCTVEGFNKDKEKKQKSLDEYAKKEGE